MTDKENSEPFKGTEKNISSNKVCLLRNILTPKKDNILRIKEINFINMNEKYQIKIKKKDFENKKKILNVNYSNEEIMEYPYVKPISEFSGKDVKLCILSSLSLDYAKYIKYLPYRAEKIQYVYSTYTCCLEVILLAYGLEENEKLFEIYVHNGSGFTFNILNIIKSYYEKQPTFYFNYYQNYYMDYNKNERKQMIINEFIRLSEDYEKFKNIMITFEKNIKNNDEIFLVENFYKLIDIIKDCLLTIKKNDVDKKYTKFNLVIDDFLLDNSKVSGYLDFQEKIRNTKKEVTYFIKYIYKLKNYTANYILFNFNDILINYKKLNGLFYSLSFGIFYVPKNNEERPTDCHNEYKKMENIINLFGNNYADLFKFKEDIDLYIKGLIDLDELENIIINIYRNDYYKTFNQSTFYIHFFNEPIKENKISYKNIQNNIYRFLFIPYIYINIEEELLEIMGPIYLKIINRIILEEKEFLILKNRSINPDPIQYGTALESYLKIIFQYRIILDFNNIPKYFIKAKQIKDSLSINWNFIKNKSQKYTEALFCIDQTNGNGQFFDFLVIKTNNNGIKISCILFFIQISINKSIKKLKEILDNFICVVGGYKNNIKYNNLEFSNAFFYIISSENNIPNELFTYCFKRKLKINITYKKLSNEFYYYPKSLFEINEIKELPQVQNYEELVSNYLKFEIFKKDIHFSISNKQLNKFSQIYNKIDSFGFNFSSNFIKDNFGDHISIKYLIELKYDYKYLLNNNIIGIQVIYSNENEKITKTKKKKNNKELKEEIYSNLLRKKTLRDIPKQIYWLNRKIFDENGNKISFEGTFYLFKIISKKGDNET